MKVPGQKPIHDDSLVPGPIEGYTVVSGAIYLCLLMRVYIPREPLPRVVLRLSHKQLLESAFVVCSSCWGYYTMDKYDYVAALGLVICMSVVPIINLWLHFDNIVFRFRRDGVLILIGVSVGGVALQLIKNAFWYFRFRMVWLHLQHLPRILRRYEKQLVESALVFVCSCWGYYTREWEAMNLVVLGLVLFFTFAPLMNLWLYFDNFGDCCLIVKIEAAVFRFRRDGVVLAAVVVAGVVMQLVKNEFRHYYSRKIKNSAEKLLI